MTLCLVEYTSTKACGYLVWISDALVTYTTSMHLLSSPLIEALCNHREAMQVYLQHLGIEVDSIPYKALKGFVNASAPAR